MNSTDIRDRFLAEADETIRNEGWSLSDEAGDAEDLITEIHNLMPDPEAYDDPAEYLEAITDEISIGWYFRDHFDGLKRDVIYTADAHRIYHDNVDECEDALCEIYGDLSAAAEGCDTISSLIDKAACCFVDLEWSRFVGGVEWQLEEIVDGLKSDLDEIDDDE